MAPEARGAPGAEFSQVCRNTTVLSDRAFPRVLKSSLFYRRTPMAFLRASRDRELSLSLGCSPGVELTSLLGKFMLLQSHC